SQPAAAHGQGITGGAAMLECPIACPPRANRGTREAGGAKARSRQRMINAGAFTVVAMLVALGETAAATGDPKRGVQVFQQCAACPSVEPNEHMPGPSLAHVWGRKAGTAQGFMRYSDALNSSGVTWNEQTLDKWLADPATFIPGNAMGFPGIRDAS